MRIAVLHADRHPGVGGDRRDLFEGGHFARRALGQLFVARQRKTYSASGVVQRLQAAVVHQGARADAAAKLDLRQHDRAAQFAARVVSQVEALESVNAVPQIKIPQNADDPLDLRCAQRSGEDDAKPGQVEFCRRVGAHTLVYHSGLQALGDVERGARLSLLTDEELVEGAAREVAAFKGIAPVAADAGVTIGMENGDPHLWEYTVLDKFNRPRAELVKHHPRLRVGPIVRQLEAIDHPNAGMTLDIAHLHLAAREIGFDYLDAVSEAAPWVRHLHVNDNFGILDRGIDSEIDRWAFGEADVHLPPGWGRIPYPGVFARLPDYQGDLILEIKAGFYDHLPEVLADMREQLAGSGAKGGETSQSR